MSEGHLRRAALGCGRTAIWSVSMAQAPGTWAEPVPRGGRPSSGIGDGPYPDWGKNSPVLMLLYLVALHLASGQGEAEEYYRLKATLLELTRGGAHPDRTLGFEQNYAL